MLKRIAAVVANCRDRHQNGGECRNLPAFSEMTENSKAAEGSAALAEIGASAIQYGSVFRLFTDHAVEELIVL